MTDERIVDYLRSRGRAEPPHELVQSVMAAVDAVPSARSPFAAFLPAAVVAGAVAIVIVVSLLVGQNPNIGPGPVPSPTSTSVTVEELEEAVAAAVDVLRGSAGVEGIGTASVLGELGSATWFSWRSGGDQIVINRSDVDVTQTGWWLDPASGPPRRGVNVMTTIQVLVGDTYYRAIDDIGAPAGWTTDDRVSAPDVLGLPFPAILDGVIEPWQWLNRSELDGGATLRRLADGSTVWTLTRPVRDGSSVEEFRIGADGALASMSGELVGVEPDLEDAPPLTSGSVELTIISDPDPIEPPDTDAVPDPAELGLPADFPLAPTGDAVDIDYRAYVEDTLDVLEAYHWNSANIDWAAARSAALDGLPENPSADLAHARIQAAIGTFDPFNTVIVRPRDVPPDGFGGGGAGPVQLPGADRIGNVGHVALPSAGGGGMDDFGEYLRAVRTAMSAVEATEPACGWVVDLRNYGAGAWGPTLMALGGLLGEGRAVSFSSDVGQWGLEVDADGIVSSSGLERSTTVPESEYIDTDLADESDDEFESLIEAEPPYQPSLDDPPVAVLVGNGTASGGEQTLVAFLGRPDTRVFGGPTAGTPIVTPNLPMADGARLRIPIWVPVDRGGTRYTTNIRPDEVIGDTRAGGTDAALEAAIEWLEEEAGCS